MTEPDLKALLERVMAASGPDRRLDADLELLVLPAVAGVWEKEFVTGPVGYSFTRWVLRKRDGTLFVHGQAWAYTASLDATLALVERVLPGSMWTSTPGYPEGKRRGQTMGVHVDRPVGSHWSTHEVPALALLAAMLTALIKDNGHG